MGRDAGGLRLRAVGSRAAPVVHVPWERLTERDSGRLLLGFGHCLTIDSAQGVTSGEHINAMPRGSAGVTAFKAYVAESRHVSQVWTMVGEAAEHQAEQAVRLLGDPRAVTTDDLWARIGRNLSEKPYKPLGMDLLAQVRRDQQAASRSFIAGRERVQRQGTASSLSAEIAARRADADVHRAVAGQLAGLERSIVAQRQATSSLRQATPQLGTLPSRVDGAIRQAASRLPPPRPPVEPASRPVRRPNSGPSPGF